MVLTFTCTINAANEGREEVGAILWAALACNVAWGIIDAFIYLFSVWMYRGEMLEAIHLIRQAKNDAEAHELIRDSLPPLMSQLLKEEHYSYFHREIINLPEPPSNTVFTLRDIIGAIKIFLLVFISTFPVTVPFIFIPDVFMALRISNGIALLLLFVTGFYFGKQTHYRSFITGLVLMGIGALLVAMTIALGG